MLNAIVADGYNKQNSIATTLFQVSCTSSSRVKTYIFGLEEVFYTLVLFYKMSPVLLARCNSTTMHSNVVCSFSEYN